MPPSSTGQSHMLMNIIHHIYNSLILMISINPHSLSLNILSIYLSMTPPTLSSYLLIYRISLTEVNLFPLCQCIYSLSCVHQPHEFLCPSSYILHLIGCVEIHVYYTNMSQCLYVYVCVCVCQCLTHPTSSLKGHGKEKMVSERVRVWGNITAMSIIRGCVCVCVRVCVS